MGELCSPICVILKGSTMAKIIWINGAFGAGKTSVAEELQRRLKAHIYDPEEAGFLIRRCLPISMHAEDFQSHPEWRTINNLLLRRIASDFDGVLLVPMTVRDPQYYRELTAGVPVALHAVLCMQHETLMARIYSRGEDDRSFAAKMADECLHAFDDIFPCALPEAVRLAVDGLTVCETADAIEQLL